jgi:hypothetical protein
MDHTLLVHDILEVHFAFFLHYGGGDGVAGAVGGEVEALAEKVGHADAVVEDVVDVFTQW